MFDFARTLARKAERMVIKAKNDLEHPVIVGDTTVAYLNRLSSLLYAMTRLSNQLSGIKEEAPNYQ
jgi:cob(I)alamin adenosyltransferase